MPGLPGWRRESPDHFLHGRQFASDRFQFAFLLFLTRTEKPRRHESRESTVSRQAPASRTRPSQGRPSITPGKLMLVGVILLIVGIKFWPLIWVGLAILAGGYMMYFVAPRSINHEKRWRGRSVDEAPRSQWDRLKRWIRN